MADLGRAVMRVKIDQPRRSHDAVFSFQNGSPDNVAVTVCCKGGFHPPVKLASIADSGEHVPPDFLLEGNLFKAREMIARQRFQPDPLAVENGSIHYHGLHTLLSCMLRCCRPGEA